MARTKINGVEIIHKRNITRSESEESEEEEPKRRKVFKKNHIYHVREWIDDPDSVPGEPAEGNSTIPVKLKENIRLETPKERDERKAAFAEAKRIESEKRLKYWVETVHPIVEIRPQAVGLNKSMVYAASPNCFLGGREYRRIVSNPEVFTSCIQVTRKNLPTQKKVYLVVGMLVELFSNPISPVLLHSIIMHQEAPHR